MNAINQINTQTLTYLPAVIAAIQAAEAVAPEGATGQQKHDAVLAAILAGGTQLTASTNATVAGISTLVVLGVQLANLLGAFKHKGPAQ